MTCFRGWTFCVACIRRIMHMFWPWKIGYTRQTNISVSADYVRLPPNVIVGRSYARDQVLMSSNVNQLLKNDL